MSQIGQVVEEAVEMPIVIDIHYYSNERGRWTRGAGARVDSQRGDEGAITFKMLNLIGEICSRRRRVKSKVKFSVSINRMADSR